MDMMGTPWRTTLAATVLTAALVLAGCSGDDNSTEKPTNSAVTVGSNTTAAPSTIGTTGLPDPSATATSTTRASTTSPGTTAATSPAATPPVTTESGDLDVSHGITLTLAPGWVVTNVTDQDDGRRHTLDHAATGGQLLLLTTDDVDDDTPAELCVEAQDELGDRYERHGTVTRTQGASHSNNAHTCGLAATDADGKAIEITIFAAVGTKAAFVTAAIFPSATPQGVSQESMNQAVREASQMSSELLNDID